MKAIASLMILFLLSPILWINAQDQNVIWTEDFESDWFNDWYVNIGTWEVGTPTSGPQEAFNGNNCAATILNGNYPSNSNTRLIRNANIVVPSASENPALRFWHWFSISGEDWGEVQVKTNTGDWQAVSIKYNNVGGVWTRTLIDLSAYADSIVQLAFYFYSSGYGESAGWYIDDIEMITGSRVFSNPDDFESGLADWSVDKGTWEVGSPTYGPENAYSGTNCAATRLDARYNSNVDSRLVSPSFIVPTASENPALRFWHWFSISGEDWGEVQVKTNTGDWQAVSIKYNNVGGVWTRTLIDLSAYADSTVQLAFYFYSSGYGESAGWYIDDIEMITGSRVFSNPDDFESGLADWSVDKGTWEVGSPTYGPENAYSGTNCAATRLDARYNSNVDSRLVSPSFIVPTASENPALRFWHWFSISGEDRGEVQISSDDGLTWETISNQAITSSSGSWTPYFLQLSSYSELEVRLAFYFYSSGYGESAGWYIDDVRITDDSDLNVYAGSDVTMISGSSTALNATVVGGTEPYEIEWVPAEGLDDPTILNPISSALNTTTYTVKVTDANACFRTDQVTVFVDKDIDDVDFLTFGFSSPPQMGDAIIDANSHSVSIQVDNGTNLTNLIASFTLFDGATAAINGVDQQSGITANDFTDPVTYTITSSDRVTTQDWLVTVTEAELDETDILSYSFSSPPQIGNATINLMDHTVLIDVEHGTGLSNLIASFSLSDGARAAINGVDQQSGITVNDFTNPLTYTITAADGQTVQDWIITVIEAESNETDIISFSFTSPPQVGNTDVNPMDHTVEIDVGNGTDVLNLIASFTLSEGATASVNGVDQQSGNTVNDFTNQLTYTIEAADGYTTQDWWVSVNTLTGIDSYSNRAMNIYPNPFSDKTFIEFQFPVQANMILSVINVLGIKVYEMEVNSSRMIFERGALSSGVYFVELSGNDIHEIKLIVIK